MGCIPVVFMEASRTSTIFLPDSEMHNATVLLDESALDDADGPEGWMTQLRALDAHVPAMRAAGLAAATRLHYAFDDLAEDDHAAVGPDALDMMLYAVAAQRRGWPKAAHALA